MPQKDDEQIKLTVFKLVCVMQNIFLRADFIKAQFGFDMADESCRKEFHLKMLKSIVMNHFESKWMAHSLEKEMFEKQAVIITNAIGAGMKNVIRMIGSSLTFWGISKVYVVRQALFEVDCTKVAQRQREDFEEMPFGGHENPSKQRQSARRHKDTFFVFRHENCQKMIHKVLY